MSSSKPIEKWTVAECKQFLQSRSIPCSSYPRRKLIELVKKALLHPALVTAVEPLERRINEVSEERLKISVDEIETARFSSIP